MKLSFRDLTPREVTKLHRLGVINGCGNNSLVKVVKAMFGVNVLSFFFEARCDHHDYNYWIGGDSKDRKRADKGFYDAMKRDVLLQPKLKRPLYRSVALSYYSMVRAFGRFSFEFGPIKTEEEVRKIIE